jgi:hypothetical protein
VQAGEFFTCCRRARRFAWTVSTCANRRRCALFTRAGRFGYFRHVLRAADLPTGELLAAHLRQVSAAHGPCETPPGGRQPRRELITLLRDD